MTAAPLTRRLQPSSSDRAFRAVVAATAQDVIDLVRALTEGTLSPAEWHAQMVETLAAAHAEAGYRGRLRAGDMAPFDADDIRFGALVAQEESEYLWRFQRDLERGRYGTEEPNVAAIQRRAYLYVARIYGTANEALALTLGAAEEWMWRTQPGENCPDCLRLEAHSPYRLLPTTPRAGDTRCLANCNCSISNTSGIRGFQP